MAENKQDSFSERDAKRVIRDHKVFWTTAPIDLYVQGEIRKVGISLVLVGTDAEDTVASTRKEERSIFDKLANIANWMVPDDTPGVKIEIRKGLNYVFYRPDEFGLNRKRYAVGIRIKPGGRFNEPFSEDQRNLFNYLQEKLKDIGCPKEHWK